MESGDDLCRGVLPAFKGIKTWPDEIPTNIYIVYTPDLGLDIAVQG